jgi:hypothetical protein
MAKGKLVRRYKRRKKTRDNPAPRVRHNPPLLTDVAEFVLPAFGGFAATRFGTRVAATQVAKRWPKLGKHAGVIASVGAFLSAWYLANRVKALAPYQMPLVVGAGIATGQTIIQTYIPRLGWVVSDATPELADASTTGGQQQSVSAGGQQVDDNFEILDENTGSWRSNLDASDPGRYAQAPNRQQTQQTSGGGNADDEGAIFDMLSTDDLDLQNMGSLG